MLLGSCLGKKNFLCNKIRGCAIAEVYKRKYNEIPCWDKFRRFIQTHSEVGRGV